MSGSIASSTTSSPTRSTQIHPSNPSASTVPNMNRNLNIKLSNTNFTGWRTQILAYIKGQDAFSVKVLCDSIWDTCCFLIEYDMTTQLKIERNDVFDNVFNLRK